MSGSRAAFYTVRRHGAPRVGRRPWLRPR